MSFTELGQVLQLQGGTPQLKSGSVFSENLPVTKNLSAPTSSVMASLLSATGLSSISQNPMAAIVGSATSAIGGLTSLLSVDATPLTLAAVSALVSSVTALGASAAQLSGAQDPPAGAYGQDDLALHYRTVHALGPAPPPQLSREAASAPLTSEGAVAAAVASATSTINSVVVGGTSDADGAAALAALAASLDAVVAASSAAISGLRAAIPALAAASAVGGAAAAAVASRSSSSEYKDLDVEALDDLYRMIIRPEAYDELKSAAMAAFYVPPPKLEPVAPIVPIGNVALRGLITIAPDGKQTIEVI